MAKRKKLKKTPAPAPKTRIIASTEALPVVPNMAATELPLNSKIGFRMVDNPYGIKEFASDDRATRSDGTPTLVETTELVSRGQPKIYSAFNLRDDPLGAMLESGQLTMVQFQGGRKWQEYYICSEIGPAKGIDPEKPKVDGGSMSMPLTLFAVEAMDMLKVIADKLGHSSNQVVRDILGRNNWTIRQAAIARGMDTQHGRRTVGKVFRQSLDLIAEITGFSTKSSGAISRHIPQVDNAYSI